MPCPFTNQFHFIYPIFIYLSNSNFILKRETTKFPVYNSLADESLDILTLELDQVILPKLQKLHPWPTTSCLPMGPTSLIYLGSDRCLNNQNSRCSNIWNDIARRNVKICWCDCTHTLPYPFRTLWRLGPTEYGIHRLCSYIWHLQIFQYYHRIQQIRC